MPKLTTFKSGARVRIRKTKQRGTVVDVRPHDPSGGRGGFYSVTVMVRLDGERDERQFEEPELEVLP